MEQKRVAPDYAHRASAQEFADWLDRRSWMAFLAVLLALIVAYSIGKVLGAAEAYGDQHPEFKTDNDQARIDRSGDLCRRESRLPGDAYILGTPAFFCGGTNA